MLKNYYANAYNVHLAKGSCMAIIYFGSSAAQTSALRKQGATVRHLAVNGNTQRELVKQLVENSSSNDYLLVSNQSNDIASVLKQAHAKKQKIIYHFNTAQKPDSKLPLDLVDIFILNYDIGTKITNCTEPVSIIRSLVNLYPQGAFVFIHQPNTVKYIDSRQRVTVPFANINFNEEEFIGYFINKLMTKHPIEYCLKYAISITELDNVSESV